MSAYTSSHDAIFQAQKEAILEIAQKPCILVGRCSNKILREAGIPSFDIFLHADKKIRIQRCIDKAQDSVKNMEKYVDKKDELRRNYYKKYTNDNISQAQDYTVCMDTGVIDYDTCIEVLAAMIKATNQ